MLKAIFKGRWCQHSPGKDHRKHTCAQSLFSLPQRRRPHTGEPRSTPVRASWGQAGILWDRDMCWVVLRRVEERRSHPRSRREAGSRWVVVSSEVELSVGQEGLCVHFCGWSVVSGLARTWSQSGLVRSVFMFCDCLCSVKNVAAQLQPSSSGPSSQGSLSPGKAAPVPPRLRPGFSRRSSLRGERGSGRQQSGPRLGRKRETLGQAPQLLLGGLRETLH